MPNHCANSVYLPIEDDAREVLKPYLSLDKDGEEVLDFNKIVPMPKELEAETTQYSKNEKENKRIRAENLKNFGFSDWYEWRLAKWDTKWNSYWMHTDGNCIRFSTAWSPPNKVICALAKLLNKPLRLTYADEAYMFWGETLIDELGNEVEDNCYDNIKDTPDEIIEELGVRSGLGLDEEEEEKPDPEDEAKLRSEAEQILMEDEGYRNLMKGMKQ
jgi:Ferredoxin-like domain in Api92-like protein